MTAATASERLAAGPWIGPGILLLLLAAGLVGPLLVPYDPVAVDTSIRLRPPLAALPEGGITLFGTDQLGRDIFAAVVAGARTSIVIGLVAAGLAGLFGTMVGVAAGWLGGRVEGAIMRIVDIQLSFPSILIAVFLAAFFPQSLLSVILVLAVTRWAQIARLTRAVTVRARQQGYVEAALVSGFSTGKIILGCILPNLAGPLMVLLTAELSLIILAESALGFLGLGTPTGVPSWGRMIAEGRNYLDNAWWISTLPGLVLALLVIGIGLTGEAIRRHLTRAGWTML